MVKPSFISLPHVQRFFLVLASLLVLTPAESDALIEPSSKRPNILLILADDLGYSDVGVYGGEISTPHIDELAQKGVSFTDFHVAATCSPTRSMLLSGVDHHLAGLGSMAGHLGEAQRGKPGYEGYLNHRVVSVARLLQEGGYRTYMTGKWHLGAAAGLGPDERGFDRSFALMSAGASHFQGARGLIARSPKAQYQEDGSDVESLPEDFYSSTFYVDRLMNYIRQDSDKPAPFFAYLSFTAPHWPLQVPDDYLTKYRGVYDEGYDKWRDQRFKKAKQLKIVPSTMIASPRIDTIPSWDSLSEDSRKNEARKMEIYAGMVEHMDAQIGRVLDMLDESGELENTLIFFMSDNGAEGNDRSEIGNNREWLPKAWDLSFANMGRKDSYVYYGGAWAQVSAAPFHMFKAYLSEGGTRSPLITVVPKSAARKGLARAFTTVVDIVPTILDYAEITPADKNQYGQTVHALQGTTMRPYLEGQSKLVHDETFAFGWELFGHRAIRKGDWKLLWRLELSGQGQWKLYNLAIDPAELIDLADTQLDKLEEMKAHWQSYVEKNNIILLDAIPIGAFSY